MPTRSVRPRVHHLHNANDTHNEKLNASDRIALAIVAVVGTMGFAAFCAVLVLVPLAVPRLLTVVLFISSGFLQLVLLPVILVQGKIQSRHAEAQENANHARAIHMAAELDAITALLTSTNRSPTI